MLWDSCNPQLQIVKTALPTQGAAALCPALQAAEQLERTCELSLLGACFVSLSEPVVSWEEVLGGGAGICYCCLPFAVPCCWLFLPVPPLLALLGTSLLRRHGSLCLVARAD